MTLTTLDVITYMNCPLVSEQCQAEEDKSSRLARQLQDLKEALDQVDSETANTQHLFGSRLLS